MSEEIKVPEFGESITQAIVVALIKSSGEYVEKGEDIVELETDKVNSVISAPASGVITLSIVLEDQVTVGQVIGSIDTVAVKPEKGEEAPAPEAEEVPVVKEAPPVVQEVSAVADGPSARSHGDDFLKDLSGAKLAPAATPPPSKSVEAGERKKMSALRKTLASHLVRVKNETAMLTTFNEVDMSEVMRIRAKEKEPFLDKHGVKLGFMSFFIKAATHGL